MSKRGTSSGFTLIEVLLVSILLFFLALALFRSVKDTITAKSSIDEGTEHLQMARASMSLMERDLRSAYFSTAEDLGWDPPQPDPAKVAAGTQDPLPVKPAPVTLFQGRTNELFVTARSHQRLSQDAPENEQHFVTYQLRGSELVRAESHRAVSLTDRESPQQFRQTTLLAQVTSLKFSYWSSRSESWLDQWDTEKDETRNELPAAIKIELEFVPEGKSRKGKDFAPIILETALRPVQSAMRLGSGVRQTPGANNVPEPVPTPGDKTP